MEPLYEEITPSVTAQDVRNACYWSLFTAPVAGITYGANGIWPWLREGETIQNHAGRGEHVSRWNRSLSLSGSVQFGYLTNFMRTLRWWDLRPAPSLLASQPGDQDPHHYVSAAQTTDGRTIVLYLPFPDPVQLYNPNGLS